MLALHSVPGHGLVPSLSPPCAKLETWLRLAAIPYVIGAVTPGEAPKRKYPYISHEGRLIGDATLLLPHLRRRYDVDPDSHLGARERAVARATRRMLKEHFYWVIVHGRWVPEAGYAQYLAILSDALPHALPLELRQQIVASHREPLLAQLDAQGLGRHSPDEVAELGKEDLDALATLLGSDAFFFGDQPSTLDVTAYASLTNVIDVAVDSPIKVAALAHPNLVAHTRRMQARFFPERSEATAADNS